LAAVLIRRILIVPLAWVIGTSFAIGLLCCFILSLPSSLTSGRVRLAYERFLNSSVRLPLRVWFKAFAILGIHRIGPPTGTRHPGPCVFIANHPTLTDSVYFSATIPGVCLVAKTGLGKYYPVRRVIQSLGYIITGDGGAFDGLRIINAAEAEILKGRSVLLFPEGTRSPSNGLNPFKAGYILLARQANVPIQPIVLDTRPPFLNHSGTWFIPPDTTVTTSVRYLEPLDPPEPGEERAFARMVEQMYKDRLNIKDTHQEHQGIKRGDG